MELSTFWIVVIIVVVFAVVISNIMLLKQSNKSFTFPDNYEKTSDPKKGEVKSKEGKLNKNTDDDDEPSSLL